MSKLANLPLWHLLVKGVSIPVVELKADLVLLVEQVAAESVSRSRSRSRSRIWCHRNCRRSTSQCNLSTQVWPARFLPRYTEYRDSTVVRTPPPSPQLMVPGHDNAARVDDSVLAGVVKPSALEECLQLCKVQPGDQTAFGVPAPKRPPRVRE